MVVGGAGFPRLVQRRPRFSLAVECRIASLALDEVDALLEVELLLHDLSVLVDALAEGLVGGDVLIAQGPGFCQFSAGVLLPEKQLHCGLAAILPRKEHVQDGTDLIVEGQFHHAAAEQHDYYVLAGGDHFVDQL